MSNFLDDNSGSTLADVLGAQADTAATGVTNAYAKKKRRNAAVAGATGRLNSGVQNYTVADTNAAEVGDLSNIYSGLADALGQIPANDYVTQNESNRQLQLAQLIADLNKPSALEQTFGALKGGTKAGSSIAGFFA